MFVYCSIIVSLFVTKILNITKKQTMAAYSRMKPKLIDSVKERLLASEGLIGRIADELNKSAGRQVTSAYTIRRQLLSDSPQLCLTHYVALIKEILGIEPHEEITERYTVGSAELHND